MHDRILVINGTATDEEVNKKAMEHSDCIDYTRGLNISVRDWLETNESWLNSYGIRLDITNKNLLIDVYTVLNIIYEQMKQTLETFVRCADAKTGIFDKIITLKSVCMEEGFDRLGTLFFNAENGKIYTLRELLLNMRNRGETLTLNVTRIYDYHF